MDDAEWAAGASKGVRNRLGYRHRNISADQSAYQRGRVKFDDGHHWNGLPAKVLAGPVVRLSYTAGRQAGKPCQQPPYRSTLSPCAPAASAATVIKLMMACNDLSVVNQALGEWKDRSARSDKTIRPGGGMYFIRAEIAHLYEALTIIGQIRDDTSLMAVVESCDQQTRDSFGKLLPYLSGGTSHDEFQQLIGLVRHNLTFHYDASGKLTQRAVADRAARADGRGHRSPAAATRASGTSSS